MKLRWFGHSAFRLEVEGAVILVDPFLSGNPSFKGSVDEVANGATHILLTHGHSDHLGDTIEIAEKTGAVVIGNFDLCQWLSHRGVARIDPANTGGTVRHGGLSFTFVNALHSSAFMTEDGVTHALGHPNGVIVTADGEKSIYFMGDTDIFGDMALINELWAPQIGVVPIGDRFTMGGRVAALACKRYFDFETVIPCHFASFPGIDQTADVFVEHLGTDGPNPVVLAIGEETEL